MGTRKELILRLSRIFSTFTNMKILKTYSLSIILTALAFETTVDAVPNAEAEADALDTVNINLNLQGAKGPGSEAQDREIQTGNEVKSGTEGHRKPTWEPTWIQPTPTWTTTWIPPKPTWTTTWIPPTTTPTWTTPRPPTTPTLR